MRDASKRSFRLWPRIPDLLLWDIVWWAFWGLVGIFFALVVVLIVVVAL